MDDFYISLVNFLFSGVIIENKVKLKAYVKKQKEKIEATM